MTAARFSGVLSQTVPLFAMLLFARDTSSTPRELMANHLNHVGDSGGLEQVRWPPELPPPPGYTDPPRVRRFSAVLGLIITCYTLDLWHRSACGAPHPRPRPRSHLSPGA